MILKPCTLAHVGCLLLLASSLSARAIAVEGVWEYRTLHRASSHEVPVTGIFAFLHGYFVQQSVNDGEPLEDQLFQAHAGTYQAVAGELELISRVGLLIEPSRQPPIESRRDARHRLRVTRSDRQLTLTFATGTIQRLEASPMPAPQLIVLTRGVLLLGGDGRFSLTAENDVGAAAGWGRYERRRDGLVLRPARWVSIIGGEATYEHDREIRAALSRRTLQVDRFVFPIERAIPEIGAPEMR